MKNRVRSIVMAIGLSISFCLFSTSFLFSQELTIQLLDSGTLQPVSEANYNYDTQTGSSDDEGKIFVTYQAGENLRISHPDYDDWVITDKELSGTEGDLVFYRKSIVEVIPAVNIIHINTNENNIQLSDADYSSQDAGALLSKLPEFAGIRKSGRFGFDPVLRGFKFDQLNIVVDGLQTAVNACPSRMDPATSHVSSNFIDRIEIIKGPFSFRYGNSFGGTVNYVSLLPAYSDKKELYGRVSANYETNGNLFTTEGSIGVKGKVYNIGLFGSWGKSSDYKDGNGNKVPSGFEKYNYGINTSFKLSDNQDLKFKVSRSYASDVEYASLGMDMRDDETWMINASHKIDINKKYLKNWETGAYMTFVDHVMDNLLRKSRKMDMTTEAKTQSHGLRSEGFWRFDQSKLYAGVDFKIDAAKGTRYRKMVTGMVIQDNAWQEAIIAKTGIFAEYQTHIDNFNVFVSGRLEWNRAMTDKGDPAFESLYGHNTDDSQINPNISLGITHDLSEKFSLGLWLGRAQRSGSISEKYINYFPVGLDPYEVVGNPKLSSEKNNQADLIFTYKTEKTHVNLDVFGSYLQDYITSVIRPDLTPRIASAPGVRQVINVKEAIKYGFEISWMQKLIFGFSHQLNMAYTYGKDLKLKEPLPEIAPLDIRYGLIKGFFNNKMNVEASLRHVIKQDRVSSSFGETKTPSFTLLDLGLSYSFTDKIRLSVAIKNLLDEAYYEHLNRPLSTDTSKYILSPGRSFMTSFIVSL